MNSNSAAVLVLAAVATLALGTVPGVNLLAWADVAVPWLVSGAVVVLAGLWGADAIEQAER